MHRKIFAVVTRGSDKDVTPATRTGGLPRRAQRPRPGGAWDPTAAAAAALRRLGCRLDRARLPPRLASSSAWRTPAALLFYAGRSTSCATLPARIALLGQCIVQDLCGFPTALRL